MLRRESVLKVRSRSSRRRKDGKEKHSLEQMVVEFAELWSRRREDNQRKGRLLDKVV